MRKLRVELLEERLALNGPEFFDWLVAMTSATPEVGSLFVRVDPETGQTARSTAFPQIVSHSGVQGVDRATSRAFVIGETVIRQPTFVRDHRLYTIDALAGAVLSSPTLDESLTASRLVFDPESESLIGICGSDFVRIDPQTAQVLQSVAIPGLVSHTGVDGFDDEGNRLWVLGNMAVGDDLLLEESRLLTIDTTSGQVTAAPLVPPELSGSHLEYDPLSRTLVGNVFTRLDPETALLLQSRELEGLESQNAFFQGLDVEGRRYYVPGTFFVIGQPPVLQEGLFVIDVQEADIARTVTGVEAASYSFLPRREQIIGVVPDVAPTARLVNTGPVRAGESARVTFADAFDPSLADQVAGFRYSFDWDNDGSWEISGASTASQLIPLEFLGPAPSLHAVRGRTADQAGNYNDYWTVIVIDQNAPRTLLVTAAGAGGSPHVRAFDAATGEVQLGLLAYHPSFTGGVHVAMGDITGDGRQDIITGPGLGGGPHVRVFDGVTGEPLETAVGSFFAYSPDFTGGVFVASGDVNGDGRDDIVTAAGAGGGPHVRVFSGIDGVELFGFFAYSPAFGGGVSVAAGDVDADGKADIITGAGAGGGPHVRAFSGVDGVELFGFFAYDPAFGGGVFVAAGDVNGDGRADVYTGAGAGGGPHARVFSGMDQTELHSFFAYSPAFSGGVRVASADLDGDGRSDIITAAGPGGGPHVRGLSAVNLAELTGFFPYDAAFSGGVFVVGAPRRVLAGSQGLILTARGRDATDRGWLVDPTPNELGEFPLDELVPAVCGLPIERIVDSLFAEVT